MWPYHGSGLNINLKTVSNFLYYNIYDDRF